MIDDVLNRQPEDALAAGNRALATLTNVCQPNVKGAHDSDFLIVDDKAYIIYMANDVEPGEHPAWDYVYVALSIVDLATQQVEKTIKVAGSGMAYANATLGTGACFVPRMVRRDARTLRCFFAHEQTTTGPSPTWYIDFDLQRQDFIWTIHPVELVTSLGPLPMSAAAHYRHAQAAGFTRPECKHGLYMISGIQLIGGRYYAALNNFPAAIILLAELNDAMDRFTIVGNLLEPYAERCSESAIQRLPDGSWLAVSRRESGDTNYWVSRSADGVAWSPHAPWDSIPNGTNSKPTLDCFGGLYYLGWQERTQVDGAFRSVFNLEVSRDGATWRRAYRFATAKSFQYPTFREYDGKIYFTVTQGDYSASRKERIMFGRLDG